MLSCDKIGLEIEATLKHTISKLIRNLLIQSIVYIVEVDKGPTGKDSKDTTLCHVVMEQCYASRVIPRKKLVKTLGSAVYLEKLQSFEKVMHSTPAVQEVKKEMFSCHRCMETFPSEHLRFCGQKPGETQLNPYPSSDHVLYKKLVFDNDYFSKSSEQTDTVFPYFKYSKVEEEPICNRAYCQKCLALYPELEKQRAFRCPFCTGTCGCKRCELALLTIRMMAYDLHYSGSDSKQRYYNKLATWFKQQPNFGSKPLRRGTEEYEEMESLYQ